MFLEMIHYLISFFIVGLLIYLIIKTHIYFSRNNVPITNETIKEQFLNR
uniref:Uncharacterized protein n=1 Tax=viral metagenome TaxID=1070528 RepID=A0A6C0I7Y1_9ZZZZ